MSGLESEDAIHVAALILIIALVVFIYFVVAYAGGFLPKLRFRRFRPPYKPYGYKNASSPDLTDVGQQLHAVMAASFEKRRLLSLPEYQTFKIVEEEISVSRSNYRVFAQTSLGEVLTSPNSNAFHSINSKRVDILIVDCGGWPVAAVEYQGGGHYQGTAAGRDAVKKEALRKAGVRYIEVSESDSADQIRYRVREQLGWGTAAPTNCGNLASASHAPLGEVPFHSASGHRAT
jgi:hypothetical protein